MRTPHAVASLLWFVGLALVSPTAGAAQFCEPWQTGMELRYRTLFPEGQWRGNLISVSADLLTIESSGVEVTHELRDVGQVYGFCPYDEPRTGEGAGVRWGAGIGGTIGALIGGFGGAGSKLRRGAGGAVAGAAAGALIGRLIGSTRKSYGTWTPLARPGGPSLLTGPLVQDSPHVPGRWDIGLSIVH